MGVEMLVLVRISPIRSLLPDKLGSNHTRQSKKKGVKALGLIMILDFKKQKHSMVCLSPNLWQTSIWITMRLKT